MGVAPSRPLRAAGLRFSSRAKNGYPEDSSFDYCNPWQKVYIAAIEDC
jgi:hypothetical protein